MSGRHARSATLGKVPSSARSNIKNFLDFATAAN